MSKKKTYDELTFSDDFMFCKVMENNPDLCKEIIELILNKKIEIVKSVDRQKSIEITPDRRGIRLDVLMEGDQTVYDLEMQNAHKEHLPKRGRYYQSLIDLDMMERGANFQDMKDSVIIFLCRFDPLDGGRSVYTIKKVVEEDPDYSYNDGTRLLFLSTLPGQKGEMSEDLRKFLDFLDGQASSSDLTNRIEQAVQRAKSQENWRKEYMFLYEYADDARTEGLAEGLAKGRAEGLTEGLAKGRAEGLTEGRAESEKEKRESARKLKDSGVAPEIIASSLNLPLEEVIDL